MVIPDYTSIIEDPQIDCEMKCMSMVKKILSDCTHPLYHHVNILPCGLRLNMIYCRTNRFHSTCVPSAIKPLNSNTKSQYFLMVTINQYYC